MIKDIDIDEYILQIIATVVAVLLLPLARTVMSKIVRQYGLLTKKERYTY